MKRKNSRRKEKTVPFAKRHAPRGVWRMRAIFDDPRRRVTVLYAWLRVLPPALPEPRNAVRVMEYYIHSIVLEESNVHIKNNDLHFNANIVVPRQLFSDDEIREITLSRNNFDDYARSRWLRDFLAVVYVRKWTLPALVAVQRLLFVERNWLRMLMDAEHMLQGQGGRPDMMPIL
jgi:hypothetical protein